MARKWGERKYGGEGSEGEQTGGEEEAKTRGFAVMCLRSFSISTEVLFIRLKSIIYAAAGRRRRRKKTMGEYYYR